MTPLIQGKLLTSDGYLGYAALYYQDIEIAAKNL